MRSENLQTTEVGWWKSFWHGQTITVARFILRSYLRSWWVLADIVFIWFLYALFFFEVGGGVPYFYSTVGQGLSVLAVLDTIVMVQRSLKNARVYMPLTRLSSRSAYIRGLILATLVLRVVYFLLMLLLAMGYHKEVPQLGINGATLENMWPGAVGLLLNCAILSILTILLLAPVATRGLQIIFLAWLALVLYADTTNNSVTRYLVVLQVPLSPLMACFNLGLTTTIDGYGLVMIGVAVLYILGLTYLADGLLVRRDLILQ